MVKLALEGAGVVAGAAVIVVGMRGRRTSSNTFCRSCGYDVTNLPGEVVTCPDCKADLSQANSIRYGERRRDWRIVAIGGVVALIALGFGVAQIFSAGVDWPKYMPNWLLVERAASDSSSTEGVLSEAMIRIRTVSLSDAQTRDLVGRALAHQGDTAQSWLGDWGSVIEAARAVGKADSAQWQEYWRRGVSPHALVRKTIRQGGPLPIAFGLGELRLGDEAVACTCRLNVAALTIDGVAWTHDLPALDFHLNRDTQQMMRGLGEAPAGVTLTPGDHVAQLVIGVKVWGYPEEATVKVPDPWQTTLSLPFHVVSANERPDVTPVTDPALGEAVNKSIFADKYVEIIKENGRPTVVVKGTCVKLPIDVAAVAQIKWNDQAFVSIGYMALQQGLEAGSSWSARGPLPPGLDQQVQSVTVQLVPTSNAAERTLGMTRVWGTPIPLGEHPLLWLPQNGPTGR
jgi:hypothetical protein